MDIITNPIKLKEIAKIRILIEYWVVNRYAINADGTIQFGMIIFLIVEAFRGTNPDIEIKRIR